MLRICQTPMFDLVFRFLLSDILPGVHRGLRLWESTRRRGIENRRLSGKATCFGESHNKPEIANDSIGGLHTNVEQHLALDQRYGRQIHTPVLNSSCKFTQAHRLESLGVEAFRWRRQIHSGPGFCTITAVLYRGPFEFESPLHA